MRHFTGSLGIPRIGWLGRLGAQVSNDIGDYKFYDTRLDDCIDNAFQALALDERRASFQPCVWEMRGNERTVCKHYATTTTTGKEHNKG